MKELKETFDKRGFKFDYFATGKEAVDFILSIIPKNTNIGFGGSKTVIETGLVDAFKALANDYTLLLRSLYPPEAANDVMKKAMNADWFIASANALCESGDIINIDGRGNRVSACIYGTKNVILLCGKNKIVSGGINEGIERARNIAAPPNCIKLNKKTPCASSGKCEYCDSPDTICRTTVIHHHPSSGHESFHVIVVGENFGN